MPVQHPASYPADPDRVVAVLTSEDHLREYAAGLGAQVTDLQVVRDGAGVQTTLHLLTSTRGIPSVFQRFVGAQVAVVDRRTWQPDGAGGHRGDLDVSARIMGRTAALRGTTLLAVDGTGTAGSTTADASVDAPLVGRQAEAAVRELAGILLRRETESVLRRL